MTWNDVVTNVKEKIRRGLGRESNGQEIQLADQGTRLERLGDAPIATPIVDVYENDKELLIQADVPGGTREGENTATITLRATATEGSCDLPETLDFGSVAVGAHGSKPVVLLNPLSTDTEAFVGPITSDTGDHLAFLLGPDSPEGPLAITARTSRTLNFEFRPTEMRAYSAQVLLRAGAHCAEGVVTLTGQDIDPHLIRIDSSQRIMLVGRDWTGAAWNGIVARVLPDGSPDSTFGSDGYAQFLLTDIFDASPIVEGLEADPVGRWYVVAHKWPYSTDISAFVVRLTAAGAVDTGFGAGGAGSPRIAAVSAACA